MERATTNHKKQRCKETMTILFLLKISFGAVDLIPHFIRHYQPTLEILHPSSICFILPFMTATTSKQPVLGIWFQPRDYIYGMQQNQHLGMVAAANNNAI